MCVPGFFASGHEAAQGGVHHAREGAVVEGRVGVPHRVQLLAHPGRTQRRLVLTDLNRCCRNSSSLGGGGGGREELGPSLRRRGHCGLALSPREPREQRLRRQHAALHRRVRALDLHGVQKSSRTTHQSRSW